MFYHLDNDDLELINKASEITITDYEIKDNSIPVDSLVSVIEDLMTEIENLNDKISEQERDIENNYELKKYDPYEEYGVSEKDFC